MISSTLMSGYCGSSFAKAGQRIVVGRMLAGRDADGAGRLVAQLAQRGELRVDLVEPRADGPQQALARFRRRHAARGAGQ